VVERFDGHVAQYLGDGLLVYFGWPRAHEDDAERGVRAGLGIVEAVIAGNEALGTKHGLRLAVRVGIHTGTVVVGEIGSGDHREILALGDTTNLAARLQRVAEPDTVVVGAATLRLVRGIFITGDRGSHMLKGFAEPVAVHLIVGPSGVRSRLDLAAGKLTPFVGRQQEVDLLLSRWEQVQEGHGRVVLVDGEAGIGKSRLVQLLHARLAEERHSWLECRSSRYHRSSAFRPIIELLEEALRFSTEDSPEEKVARLEAALDRAGFDACQTLPLLTTLLSLPLPDRYPPLFLSPEAQRQRTLELLANWLFSLTTEQAMVLVVEDLQWADPSSLELWGRLVEQVPTVPLLLVLTARPEFAAPWGTRSHLLHLTLSPLTRPQMETMVEAIAEERTLPGTVVEEVVTRADGVPLFVEELTKSVLEARLEGLEIPATLQDVLMARLDRLGPAKEVAQLASVLGRAFTHELLAAVSPLEAPSLEAAVSRLLEAEILYQRGAVPSATYSFKHALIEDAAYGSLLRSARQRLHERIAELLEKEFPERAQAQPELLAHHYERGGRTEEAISYYQRAGDAAQARSSNAEAIAHVERGVKLTGQLPEGAERCERELALQLSLGEVRIAAQGYASEETRRTWERARTLCRVVGSSPQLAAALYGLSLFHHVRSELDTAIELGEELLAVARRSGDNAHLRLGYGATGTAKHWQGRFREALQDFEALLGIYEPMRHAAPPATYVTQQAVIGSAHSSWTLWYLGYADRSVARAEQAVEQARALAHPYTLSFVLLYATIAHVFRREWETAERCCSEGIGLDQRHGFPLALGALKPARALAVARRSGEDSVAEATEGIAIAAGTAVGTGQLVGVPAALWMLAGIHQEQGREADALGAVEAALAASAQGRQSFYDAELLRLKGELLLSRDEAGAEIFFHRALDVARSQEARSLELRAATEIARLWQRQGKRGEARDLLQPVYDWFTEGFDTQDLKDAKALLEALA
jgi:tetratricopeptide (TPR) repeat protein